MKGKYVTKRDADAKAFSTKHTRDIYVLKTKIAHVEDKIRVTEIDKQKLKKLQKEKIAKIENEKRNIEENIDKALTELNKKKEKIYNIQKPIVEKFKLTLKKLTTEYDESMNRSNQLLNGDNELNSKKNNLQNEGQKIKEMYEQATEEFNQLKEEAQGKLKEMNTIKEQYPKEYQYFQEKIKLFKKINDLKEENKNINNKIKELQKNISEDTYAKQEKNSFQKQLSTEKNRNENKIEELKSGIALEQLENDLKKHNSDIFSWSYIKELMIQYYGEKYYNEGSDEYIDNLRNMWTNRINYIFNEEYLRTKRAKEARLETILNRISEIELNNKNENEEAIKLNEESETLKEELTIDENDFNKVYSIFNDAILLLNQINKENKDDLFSNHFVESIININPDYSTTMKEYAKQNFDRLINLYINELIEHSKSKKNLIMRNKKCDEFMEEKNSEALILENQIKSNNDQLNELTNKKEENNKEITKIKNLIDVKTTEMKKYLNEICDEKFKAYKEENSETLKNFNKIYGKKILTKTNKVQKEKIYEDRINQHLQMKETMDGLTNYISQYRAKNKELTEKIEKLSENYQEIMDQVDEMGMNDDDNKELANKEEEKRNKLKQEMDEKVKEQAIKLKAQKEKLEKQENIEYYIETLKKLNNELKTIEKKKEKAFDQFALFFQQVQEEQLKLQEQSHQLKLQLLEFKVIEDENAFSSKVRMNIGEEEKVGLEEEKNNYDEKEDEEKKTKRQELLKSKQMKNKLALPDNTDIFGAEADELNQEIEIPDIDMYNEKIKPLFEGTKVYKRFSEKAVKTEYEEYDPIKNKGILPEAYDYCLRKLYANINEKQFEFFTIDGLPKKEAILPFDQIHGIRYSDNAKKIIKIKEDTPQTGIKTDFIGRDNIPFSIMTKNNNWDIVCPEYTSYVAIKTMIDSILSQPKQKEQIEVRPYSSGEIENDANEQNEQEEEHYEEYEE
jgi:hypothetical protein